MTSRPERASTEAAGWRKPSTEACLRQGQLSTYDDHVGGLPLLGLPFDLHEAERAEPVGQVDVRRRAVADVRRAQRRPGAPQARRGDMPLAPSAGETLDKASPQNAGSPLFLRATIKNLQSPATS